ncbi:MAG: DUF3368 domain-containing protein [Verrucomicrobia bacterium]|nr:DUF3368 domain-containing protein [Verrucomicrobiota bacterium]
MILVADTGPIIAFAKADCLHLLSQLAAEVFIPPRVHRELLAKTDAEADRIEAAVGSTIRVRAAGFVTSETESATEHLGDGERDAIHLASSFSPAVMVLMDDQAGRRAAVGLELPVIGTVGLLLAAKEKRLAKSVSETLLLMRANGYWLSDKIIAAARRLARE